MNEDLHLARARVLRATALMALVAAVLTVVVILPAEFGRDLTGFGRLTGLTRLAAVRAAAAGSIAAAVPATATAELAVAATGAPTGVLAHPVPVVEWSHAHGGRYASGKFQVQLEPYAEIEYKATLVRGEPLLYRWSVREGSAVHYEFHGEPTEGQWVKDFYESYQLGEGTGGQGSMVAPFTGHHGWYWVNLSGRPITIDVELLGYYSGFGPVAGPS
jgi:hypothetical protein